MPQQSFLFYNGTLKLGNQSAYFFLPPDVKAHLETRRSEELKCHTNNRILLGVGIEATILRLGIGGFVLTRKKMPSLQAGKLSKAFPSPFQNEVHLKYTLSIDTQKPNCSSRILKESFSQKLP